MGLAVPAGPQTLQLINTTPSSHWLKTWHLPNGSPKASWKQGMAASASKSIQVPCQRFDKVVHIPKVLEQAKTAHSCKDPGQNSPLTAPVIPPCLGLSMALTSPQKRFRFSQILQIRQLVLLSSFIPRVASWTRPQDPILFGDWPSIGDCFTIFLPIFRYSGYLRQDLLNVAGLWDRWPNSNTKLGSHKPWQYYLTRSQLEELRWLTKSPLPWMPR